MKPLFILLLTLLLPLLSYAEKNEPIVVLYERNPRLMVIGSDSPTFVAYETGQIIWRDSAQPVKGKYLSVKLDQHAVTQFVGKLEGVFSLDGKYILSEDFDQPTTDLVIRAMGQEKSVFVYGRLSAKSVRDKAPQELLDIYDYIKNYQHEDSVPWTPQYIEVMVWPYDYAPEESVIWPEGWPDTTSDTTQKRGELHSIYLPIQHEKELLQLLSTRKPKGAVEINGSKWAVSTRIPLPHEMP